mmetsp:Transcript_9221/g.22819  ORF Transcript_9221/g.22819 Transcript_9221/m.22819 type:complete len:270 (+) Transcript_9221:843-1652(+)
MAIPYATAAGRTWMAVCTCATACVQPGWLAAPSPCLPAGTTSGSSVITTTCSRWMEGPQAAPSCAASSADSARGPNTSVTLRVAVTHRCCRRAMWSPRARLATCTRATCGMAVSSFSQKSGSMAHSRTSRCDSRASAHPSAATSSPASTSPSSTSRCVPSRTISGRISASRGPTPDSGSLKGDARCELHAALCTCSCPGCVGRSPGWASRQCTASLSASALLRLPTPPLLSLNSQELGSASIACRSASARPGREMLGMAARGSRVMQGA